MICHYQRLEDPITQISRTCHIIRVTLLVYYRNLHTPDLLTFM